MRLARPGVRSLVLGATILASIPCAYWTGHGDGYNAGFSAGRSSGDPDYHYLVESSKSGGSYTVFNLRKPADLKKLQEEEARLKAAGATYHVEKAHMNRSIQPVPDPGRLDAHR